MRKTIVLSGSFAVLLVLLALFLVMRQRAAQPGKQFQVRDPEKIRRIVFRRDTSVLELMLKEGAWRVNDRWPVRDRAMKVLLKVLGTMEVKSPLSTDRAEGILKDSTTVLTHVKVSGAFFTLKQFDAVRNSGIPAGNIMRLKGKKDWFIVQVPGEDINPASLFVTDPYYWRDLTLFRFLPGEVTEVEIRYGKGKNDGFRAGEDTLTGKVIFLPFDPSLAGEAVDTGKVRKFLTYFQTLSCDAWDRSVDEAGKDSILHQTPLYVVEVRATRHRSFRMKVYPLADRKGEGTTDPDVARAWVEPAGEMVLIKYYRIDPFLFRAKDFLTGETQ